MSRSGCKHAGRSPRAVTRSGETGRDPRLSTPRATDLDGPRLVVQAALLGVQRGRLADLPLDRQRLAHEVLAPVPQRVRDAVRARDAEDDPVGDLEAGLLARVLHGADQLAGEALAHELRRQAGVERGEETGVLGAGVTFGRMG